MSSASIRTSTTYTDRRATNGTSAAGDKARPRMSAHDSFKSQQSEAKQKAPSPQPQFAGTSHKRSASGNPRPASRATEERRTERHVVTTRETLVSRTKSPDRRSAAAAPSAKSRGTDGERQRASEAKVKDARAEPPPQGM